MDTIDKMYILEINIPVGNNSNCFIKKAENELNRILKR